MVRRQPHVSRGPYLPPKEPPSEPLASLLLGAAAVVIFAITAFLLWPLL